MYCFTFITPVLFRSRKHYYERMFSINGVDFYFKKSILLKLIDFKKIENRTNLKKKRLFLTDFSVTNFLIF